MKKYMIADLIKEAGFLEDYSQYKEYNPDIGSGPIFYTGTYYELEIEFDKTNDNYVVTIDWNKGGSTELIVDGDDAAKIADKGLDESKRNPPMPWPFGSKDYLHWPNQIGK